MITNFADIRLHGFKLTSCLVRPLHGASIQANDWFQHFWMSCANYSANFRFPNVVVGVLTRDSVRQAFRGGITAEQIISYLEQHAHPSVT